MTPAVKILIVVSLKQLLTLCPLRSTGITQAMFQYRNENNHIARLRQIMQIRTKVSCSIEKISSVTKLIFSVGTDKSSAILWRSSEVIDPAMLLARRSMVNVKMNGYLVLFHSLKSRKEQAKIKVPQQISEMIKKKCTPQLSISLLSNRFGYRSNIRTIFKGWFDSTF